MTVASATNSYAGKAYDIVVELVIGSTTHYWSTAGVTDSANNYQHYAAKILEAGSIDRSMQAAPIATADCTMRIENVDGALDTFINYTTATESVVLGTFTVKRVEASETLANAQTLGVFHSLRFSFNRDKTITVYLANDELFFGEVPTYTNADIVTHLRTDFATRFGASGANVSVFNDRIGDLVVPYAFGSFPVFPALDGILTTAAFLWQPSGSGAETSIGSTTAGLQYYVGFAALNPYGFYTTPPAGTPSLYAAPYSDTEGGLIPADGGFYITNTTGTVDYEVINLANLGNNGLDVLVLTWPASGEDSEAWELHAVAEVFTKTFSGEVRTTPKQYGGGNALDLARMVVEELGSTAQWNSVGANNFAALKRKAPYLEARGTIYNSRPALEYVAEVGENFDIKFYVDKSGVLQAHLLSPEGKGGTYSSSLAFTDTRDFVGLGAAYTVDGKSNTFGLTNLASFGIGPNTMQSRVRGGGFFWRPETAADPMSHDGEMITKKENTTSQTNHGRTETLEQQRPWVANAESAAVLASRLVDIKGNPRAMLRTQSFIRGSQLDLGYIVKVTEGMAPGWSADRYCVVWSHTDNLTTGLIELTLVDFNDLLSASVYIADNEENWTVMTQGSGESVDFTASTATIACNGFDPAAKGILAGDIFSRRGWPGAAVTGTNDFNCVINAVNGTPTNTIVLEAGGGEDGSLPGTNESTATDFRIYRGEANRATSGGDYTAADNKYGVLCWSDGFFRDDATEGYKYGVNL